MSFLCPSIPRSLVFTALLLLSRLTAEAHAKTSKHSIAANGFTESCGFNLGGFVYNLCPLIDARVSAPDIGRAMFGDDLEGGPSSGRRVFSLDIGAGNGRSPEQSLVNQEASGCDNETWICLTEKTIQHGKNAVKFIPLVQVGSEITVILDVEENGERVSPTVRLSTTSSNFIVSCSGVKNLRHFSEEVGVYSFIWDTPHACPTNFNILADQPNDEVPPGEEKGGNDDLMPQGGMSMIRKLMIAAFFTLVIPLVCGIVLLSSPRTRSFTINRVNGVTSSLVPFISVATVKLRPIGNKIKSLNSKLKSPFRQGGNKLVIWAQEDMSLADSEDVMVNGSGAFDEDGWNADGLEEYIPLSLNPRHGRRAVVRSYGATPTVETFSERQQSWLSGIGRYFRR